MADVAALAILLAVLVAVVRPPRPWPELAWAGPAALLVLALGLETPRQAWDAVWALGPTLGFLAGILVVGSSADAAGLFDAARRPLDAAARRGPAALLAGVVGLTVLVTSVLSLDATAVLLTPVVVRVVRGRSDADRSLLATAFLANGGSLLLPVANLTNLLVVGSLGLSFPAFAARMALPTMAVAGVVGGACWVLAGPRAPAGDAEVVPGPPPDPAPLDGVGRLVAVGVVVLLAGFVVASLTGTSTAWVALAGATVLGLVVWRTGRTTPRRLGQAASPDFVAFVGALAIVVDAARRHGLGDAVADHVPHGSSFLALLAMAALAAALANLVNNLPATLVLLPAVAGRGVGLGLALLLGVNIGPNLTYTGSLATLLWRKAVRAEGVEPATRTFLRTAWAATPVALVAATAALWAGLRVL